ncbi:hypothetical protein C8R47DRAFT_1095257 [Mycena vitilis]|nr:hypothetical protein C8R47DRAFT_1095257 [Mycena vitilis]
MDPFTFVVLGIFIGLIFTPTLVLFLGYMQGGYGSLIDGAPLVPLIGHMRSGYILLLDGGQKAYTSLPPPLRLAIEGVPTFALTVKDTARSIQDAVLSIFQVVEMCGDHPDTVLGDGISYTLGFALPVLIASAWLFSPQKYAYLFSKYLLVATAVFWSPLWLPRCLDQFDLVLSAVRLPPLYSDLWESFLRRTCSDYLSQRYQHLCLIHPPHIHQALQFIASFALPALVSFTVRTGFDLLLPAVRLATSSICSALTLSMMALSSIFLVLQAVFKAAGTSFLNMILSCSHPFAGAITKAHRSAINSIFCLSTRAGAFLRQKALLLSNLSLLALRSVVCPLPVFKASLFSGQFHRFSSSVANSIFRLSTRAGAFLRQKAVLLLDLSLLVLCSVVGFFHVTRPDVPAHYALPLAAAWLATCAALGYAAYAAGSRPLSLDMVMPRPTNPEHEEVHSVGPACNGSPTQSPSAPHPSPVSSPFSLAVPLFENTNRNERARVLTVLRHARSASTLIAKGKGKAKALNSPMRTPPPLNSPPRTPPRTKAETAVINLDATIGTSLYASPSPPQAFPTFDLFKEGRRVAVARDAARKIRTRSRSRSATGYRDSGSFGQAALEIDDFQLRAPWASQVKEKSRKKKDDLEEKGGRAAERARLVDGSLSRKRL